MNNEFEKILDNEETILLRLKPNKKRYFFSLIGSSLLTLLFVLVFFVFVIVDAVGKGDYSNLYMVGIFFIVVFIPLLISLIIRGVGFKKVEYAITNKRILIKSGIIGADFHTLEFKTITGMNVNVDFLDKLMKPNTGSIIFASPSIFVNSRSNRSNTNGFNIMFIEDPYENFKKIKGIMDQNKY